MPNLYEPEWESMERDGVVYRRARLGRQAGAQRIGASLYELPPGGGGSVWPYHYHLANEEMLIVLDGTPTLRTPDGRRTLAPGELVSFPVGEAGAHQLFNETETPVRVLVFSEMNSPELAVYPDSQKVGAFERAPGSPHDTDIHAWFRIGDQVDYWEGECGTAAPGRSPRP